MEKMKLMKTSDLLLLSTKSLEILSIFYRALTRKTQSSQHYAANYYQLAFLKGKIQTFLSVACFSTEKA